MKRKGFTLIELLVVIAIIAILAAILFPVFVNAREKARQTACLSNMSQLAKAFKMYLDDNSGRYPCPGDIPLLNQARTYLDSSHIALPGRPDGDWMWWEGTWKPASGDADLLHVPWTYRADPAHGSIWRYTSKSAKIFVCPSDKHSNNTNWTDVTNKGRRGFGLSYDLNNDLWVSHGYGGSYSIATPAYESEIIRTTKTVLLADHGDGSVDMDPQYAKLWPKFPEYQQRHPCFDGVYRWWQESPAAVHCGGQNWVFCDGHAKWLSIRQWHTLVFHRDGTIEPPGSPNWKNPEARDY